MFESLDAEQTGIDFVHQWAPDNQHKVVLGNAFAGGGVCIGDYDSDGLPDVYLTRPHGGGQLYRNLGDFRFENVTDKAGVADDGVWGAGTTFVDIDNDEDLDLFVCGYECPNRLYLNQGDGTFGEIPQAFGLDFSGASVMMAFADYDLDGDLDGYLVTNRRLVPKALRQEYEDFLDACRRGRVPFRDGKYVVPESLREFTDILRRPRARLNREIQAGQPDRLYRNDADADKPSFKDVSDQVGIGGYHNGLSATWWDYNDDGLPDLYVANDFWGPDHLYRNNGPDAPSFTDVAEVALPHTPWFSMGSDTADINNDGRLDFVGSDMSSADHYKSKLTMGDMEENGWFLSFAEPRQYMRNAVYLNTGTDRFMEVAYLTGLADTDWTWSVKFADLDNDGRVDLFFSNGMTRYWFNSDLRKEIQELGLYETQKGWQVWFDSPMRREPNLAFKNLGDLHFESFGQRWGLDYVGVSFGAALGDLDGDGDLDLIVNNFAEPVSVYRNQNDEGHRVLIRLKGTISNRYGIGAMVRVRAGTTEQVRYLTLSRGFMSANDPKVHFGLGEHEKIDRLSVEWPSGHRQKFESLEPDCLYTITEPSRAPPQRRPQQPQSTLFRKVASLPQRRHREVDYNDYERQPLLPNKLSQLGPGLALSDVDGDGDEDLYVGGAAGQLGALMLKQDNGVFQPKRNDDFAVEAGCEDMTPLFFDADGDGDQDLYVVSGSVEYSQGDIMLRDRLYRNDGTGNFTAAPADHIADLRDSGSIATVADFDRDGDLDLFVGGRSIPGQYPLCPDSRLLRNDNGRLTDVTDELAPGLKKTGLVTSAVWSDANDDGWLDLMVTHEWGPVKLWGNDGGRLVDRTDKAGLADRLGWWNAIAARDVDNDGDIDYAVTNFGLNTKYHPTFDQPALLYYGNFDGTNTMRLVEAKNVDATLLPIRGKSCSTNAMPHLANRFPTFHAFAGASLMDIYTEECLVQSHKFEANSLESGVWINNGNGGFSFQPLPRLAQVAPGFGVVLTEVDGDGKADLYLVQNFFSPQPETGRMDGGLSLLLLGRGDGTFEPVMPDRSGLIVPGDAKGLASTDLNSDGWVDFVVTINDGQIHAFENRGSKQMRVLNVRLQGHPGNPTAVGARVTLTSDDGTRQTAEVQSGGGYLSQSSSALVFGLGQTAKARQIEVRWPDGQVSRHRSEGARGEIVIRQPAR